MCMCVYVYVYMYIYVYIYIYASSFAIVAETQRLCTKKRRPGHCSDRGSRATLGPLPHVALGRTTSYDCCVHAVAVCVCLRVCVCVFAFSPLLLSRLV